MPLKDLLRAARPYRTPAVAVVLLLRRVNREHAMAILFVTHNAALARRCDSIIEVIDGMVPALPL